MSEPAKKRRTSKQKKQAEPKRAVKMEAPKPIGAPPNAIVEVRHGERMMQRQARGYSQGEVAHANLNVGLARRWGVHVDDRRKSVLGGNVASLRKWAPRAEKASEEKVEGEVRKIEKVVEKEVRKVEKKAKKVEEEVVEKVEAPIKKRSKKKAAEKKETA